MEAAAIGTPAICLDLEADRLAPAHARHAFDNLNHGIGGELLARLKLLASELVTNSVLHAGLARQDRIALIVDVAPRSVRVEVHDPGRGFIPPEAPGGLEEDHGRGLLLVHALSDRWGVTGGRSARVWFEIDRV